MERPDPVQSRPCCPYYLVCLFFVTHRGPPSWLPADGLSRDNIYDEGGGLTSDMMKGVILPRTRRRGCSRAGRRPPAVAWRTTCRPHHWGRERNMVRYLQRSSQRGSYVCWPYSEMGAIMGPSFTTQLAVRTKMAALCIRPTASSCWSWKNYLGGYATCRNWFVSYFYDMNTIRKKPTHCNWGVSMLCSDFTYSYFLVDFKMIAWLQNS